MAPRRATQPRESRGVLRPPHPAARLKRAPRRQRGQLRHGARNRQQLLFLERRRRRQQPLCIRMPRPPQHLRRWPLFGPAQTQRFSTGITNLSAVCVAEKPTTFISFKPHFRPAARTSFSVICFCPLGYTIHSPAAPFNPFASFATCDKSLELSAAKKIHSASTSAPGPAFPLLLPVTLTFFVTERSSPRKSASKSPTKETAAFGLMPNFSNRVLGCRIFSHHFVALAPSWNIAGPSAVSSRNSPSAALADFKSANASLSRKVPSSLRKITSAVSSSALPRAFCFPNRTTQTTSFPTKTPENSPAKSPAKSAAKSGAKSPAKFFTPFARRQM